MQYTVHFFNENYHFLFENQEQGKFFKGTFNFVLENLKIEGEQQGATKFSVELAPGASLTRKISRVDPEKESKYKCSYSYCFTSSEAQGLRDEKV